MAGVELPPRRVELGVGGALVLLVGEPRRFLLTPAAIGLLGLTPLLFLLLGGALRPASEVERRRLVGHQAQGGVAPDDRGAELTRRHLGVGLGKKRGGLGGRLGAAARRRFGRLPRDLDLGPQALEHLGVGPIARRLIGVAARFVERAVHDGAPRLLDGDADALLARPLARRGLVDRVLGALADRARLVEAGLVELGLGAGADRRGPVPLLERAARPLHRRDERLLVAGAGHRLAHRADAGVAGPHLDGAPDERVGALDVAAGERRLRVREVFVRLLVVQSGLRLGTQLRRPGVVLVDGAGAVGVLDRLLEEPGLERLGGRGQVPGHLLGAHPRQALGLGSASDVRLGRGGRRRVRHARIGHLDPRVLDRGVVALEATPHARQVAVHRRQVRIAASRVLLERLVDDLLDLDVGLGDHPAQPGRRLLRDAPQDAVAEAARKRLLVGQELEHHRTAREDVGAMVDRQAAHLLGRHVVEAADQRAGVGDARVGELGDAEVEDLEPAAALLDHQVGRLDVAVDDVEGVGVGQAVAELLEQAQLAHHRGGLLAADPLRQRLAVDVLHGDERLAVLLADVEDADDVLVLEDTGGVRFLHEAAPDLVVVDAFLEELDRDRAAADLGIPGAQERAHATRADRPDDFVATDRVGNSHVDAELYVFAGPAWLRTGAGSRLGDQAMQFTYWR